MNRRGHGTVDVGGVPTYYDEAGAGGPPIFLLHGGMSPNASWAGQWDDLGAAHRVVAPERRGHGHTPDVAGPMSYEAMTEETVAVLRALAGEPAHLVGWSDGGIVALRVARSHPELVAKVVAFGANSSSAGYVAGAIETLVGLAPDSAELGLFRALYDPVSPDGPGHFEAVWAKIQQLWTAPFDFTAELARIEAPVLVMVADDDMVTLAHAVEMYEHLADGQLAVLPGLSHAAPMEAPDRFNRVVLEFLAPEGPDLLLPVRRRPPGRTA